MWKFNQGLNLRRGSDQSHSSDTTGSSTRCAPGVPFVCAACLCEVPVVIMLFSFSPPEDLPEEVRERWEAFCASSLGETNKRNTVDLVGSTRLHCSDFRALELCAFVQKDAKKHLPFVLVIGGQG